MAQAVTQACIAEQFRTPRNFGQGLLPNGRWYGQVQVTGDASGGDIVVTFELNLATSRKYWHSIQEAMVQYSDNTAKVCRYASAGDSGSPRFAANPIAWNEELVATGTGAATTGGVAQGAVKFQPQVPNNAARLSEIVYGPARDAARQVVLRLANTDTIVYIFRVWGYLWEAQLVAQGLFPVRPG